MALEAVNHAIDVPRAISASTFTEAPEPEVIDTQGVAFSFDYVQGFWGSGATSISPETDALHNSFAAVLPIPKYLLPVGSEITIQDGYQYRVIYFNKTGEDSYQVIYRSDLVQTNYVMVDEAFWGNYDYVGFNIATNPYSNISTRLDDVASMLKLFHPEGTGAGHVDTELSWTPGLWELGNQTLSPDNNYVSSNPLTPEYFDYDTVFEVMDGYQQAYVVLSFIEGQYNVESISDFTTEDIYIDEAFADGKALIAIIVTTLDQATDISSVDLALIISVHPGIVLHLDESMSFVSGYWETGKTERTTTNSNMAFLNQYAASQPQSKHYYKDIQMITVPEGYQVRIIYITYDGFGQYMVAERTAWTTGVIVLDDTFWGSYEFIAFNIALVAVADISDRVQSLGTMFLFDHTGVTFELGYWNTGGSSLVSSTSYAGSNVIPRQFLPAGSKVTVSEGYQVRVIFLSYDSENGYKVLARTDNYQGSFVLNDGYYQAYQYVAFNISTVPTTNLTESVDTLGNYISFESFDEETIVHIDALTFTSGYWNNAAYQVTTGDTDFIKGFAASSVLSKAYFDGYTTLTIAEGYQVRIIFFDYSYNQYTVLARTDNFSGSITLDDTFWGDYEYVGFNISKIVAEDLSTLLDSLPGLLTLS